MKTLVGAVKVGPLDIPLVYCPEMVENHGMYHEDVGPEILLGPSTNNNASWTSLTVFHECLHVLFRQGGVNLKKDAEEAIVTLLEFGIPKLLRDNPHLLKDLLNEQRSGSTESASNRGSKTKGRKRRSTKKAARAK